MEYNAALLLVAFIASHLADVCAEKVCSRASRKRRDNVEKENSSESTNETTGFSVVTPELAIPGGQTAILVTIHDRNTTANVTVRLETQRTDANEARVIATESRMISEYGYIPLKVPHTPSVQCTVHTSIEYANSTSVSHTTMRILSYVRHVIISTNQNTYKLGDTLTFWIMVLDHDLNLKTDIQGTVLVRDGAGTTVAVWKQFYLDQGVKSLSLAISEFALAGAWRIEANYGAVKTSVDVNVSRNGLHTSRTSSAAGEQHYVELRFSDSMRRRYKPGLPFYGRVEALSTEQMMRVRVKLYEGTTPIYSEDVDVNTDAGLFMVPNVMTHDDVIFLQAELVAVEGKEIETHYVLARERIAKWNSTIKCYILIQSIEKPFLVSDHAEVEVWSSCGCPARLMVAVVTSGRATYWQTIDDQIPFYNTTSDIQNVCRFNYSFPVSASMAPVSSLLFYYMTEYGEPVSDVVMFHVTLQDMEVSLKLESRDWWYPESTTKVHLTSQLDTTTCLIGTKNDTPKRFDPRQIIKSNTGHSQLTPEFVNAGVSLYMGGETGCGGGVLYRQRTEPTTVRLQSKHLLGADMGDKIWIWKCFNYTKETANEGFSIVTPSEAGKWSLWLVTLTKHGLRYSTPAHITVFQPIELTYSVPSYMKVGEVFQVNIQIKNNIQACTDITALISLSQGAVFTTNRQSFVTEKLRLGARDSTQVVVQILIESAGTRNISVELTAYKVSQCESADSSSLNDTLIGSVVKSASIVATSKGVARTFTQSAYFCANEQLIVSKRNSTDFSWLPAPRNRPGIVIEVKSSSSVHIVLSSDKQISDDTYHLVIGERGKIWIGIGKHVGTEIRVCTGKLDPSDLECEHRWCIWNVWWGPDASIRLAMGSDAVTVIRCDVENVNIRDSIKYIGLATRWTENADFRVWNFNDESGFSQVLEIELPNGVIPGSANGHIQVSGGLQIPSTQKFSESPQHGPTLSMVIEQLMPVYVLDHAPHLMQDESRIKFLERIPEMVQTLLSFRKNDNSFSDHFTIGSHKSTLIVLEILSRIQNYSPIDPNLLTSIKKWIISRQEGDGSYLPLPGDVTMDNWDGDLTTECNIDKLVEITAETVVTLMEIGVDNENDAESVSKSQKFLEDHLHITKKPYSLASAVYALVLARSSKLMKGLDLLRNATTNEDGEFGWPQTSVKTNEAEWLYDDNSKNETNRKSVNWFEETYQGAAAVLGAETARGHAAAGEVAARALLLYAFRYQNRLPVLVHRTLAQYAALAYDSHRALTVSLATAGMELTDTIELSANSQPRSLQLPGLPTKLFVYATGAGCATVQGAATYSTYDLSRENSVLELTSYIIKEVGPSENTIEQMDEILPTITGKTCFRWKGEKHSSIIRLEITLFSGYEIQNVNPVYIDESNLINLEYDSRDNFVWFVIANITSKCFICITYQASSKYILTALKPAYAKVYPAMNPELAVETFFHGNKGSRLLKDVPDDDFTIWLYNYNRTIEECKPTNENITKSVTNTNTNTEMVVSEKTPALLSPTDKISKNSDANQTVENDLIPIISKILKDEIIVRKSKLSTKNTVKEAKPSMLPRKKGTLKATYGAKHTLMVKPTETKEVINQEQSLYVKNLLSLNKTSTNKSVDKISVEVFPTQMTIETNKQVIKTVNRKIHEIPFTPYSETTKSFIEESKPKPTIGKKDNLVLLNKNDLWELLKEVSNEKLTIKNKFTFEKDSILKHIKD